MERGEKNLLRHPGSGLGLGGGRTRRAKIIAGMETKNGVVMAWPMKCHERP